MGTLVAYVIGAICILLPKPAGKVIAEVLDQITKRKYGAATEEQKQVRPVFSIIVGIIIISFAYSTQ